MATVGYPNDWSAAADSDRIRHRSSSSTIGIRSTLASPSGAVAGSSAGRKIGTYQAVRHPCADMALRAEAARCQLWSAAAALKERRADVQAHLDAAQHLANEAATMNADASIQLHGGIGVTDEHHAHLLLKHGLVLSRLFGPKRTVLARLLHAELEV